MTLILSLAYFVGFTITALGLIGAYRRATLSYREAAKERSTREGMERAANEDLAVLMKGYTAEGHEELERENARRHQEAGLQVKTNGEANVDMAMTTKVTDTATALVEAKNNLLFAGLGLVISTLASILSLF